MIDRSIVGGRDSLLLTYSRGCVQLSNSGRSDLHFSMAVGKQRACLLFLPLDHKEMNPTRLESTRLDSIRLYFFCFQAALDV
jgi:hypothetical protein